MLLWNIAGDFFYLCGSTLYWYLIFGVLLFILGMVKAVYFLKFLFKGTEKYASFTFSTVTDFFFFNFAGCGILNWTS